MLDVNAYYRSRRAKNYTLLGILVGLVGLFFILTLVKLSGTA